MSKKTVVMIVFLILMPLIIYFVWPSDESRIRKLFRQGARAVEQEKIDDVMSKVSFTYSDEHGLSYLLIKNGMMRLFEQMSGISIEYEVRHIEISEDKLSATAELDMRIIASRGQDTGYIAGDAKDPIRLKFFLEKERARWLVVRVEGLPVGY